MPILVCPLSRVQALAAHWGPTRVISVLDPGHTFPEIRGIAPDRHLRLSFHDAHLPGRGITVPSPEHLGPLLLFVRDCAPGDRLLIHCLAGIARSTATAFITACDQHPSVSEYEIATILRRAAPLARPNETLVRVADAAMSRGGRMSAAIADTGRGLPGLEVPEGEPFELAMPLNDSTPEADGADECRNGS